MPFILSTDLRSSPLPVIVRVCCDSSTCLTDCRHFVNMPETRRLARIIHDGSSRNRAVAKRDRRAEPRGRKAYLKQYVDRLNGEPACLDAVPIASRCVVTALARSSALYMIVARRKISTMDSDFHSRHCSRSVHE